MSDVTGAPRQDDENSLEELNPQGAGAGVTDTDNTFEPEEAEPGVKPADSDK